MGNYRLEVRNLHKRFPGVYAIKGVSFQVAPGEVHALVGENGAGKSTLMKMITGEYTPDEGEIFHNGEQIKPKSIADSQKTGISMIHQELAPLPDMTIADNIFLGQEIMKGKFLNDREMIEQTKGILREYGMDFDPKLKVGSLSVAQIQMLEIIKAVRKNADIIIMDEPTSSLSDEESQKLFKIIKELTDKGVSIIYISHRLEEILKLTDRITVLRDGEYIKTVDAKGVTQNELVEMMVGRSLDQIYPKEKVCMGDVVFEAKNLSRKGVFEDISFQVHAGEIVGFSGLVGAGRSEIMNAVFGLDKLDSGQIFMDGQEIKVRSPQEAIKNKIALVSEDRKIYGLVLCRSIKENISLPNLPKLHKNLFINSTKEKNAVEDYRKSLGIKCATTNVAVGTLSGGNQQKVVLAKWLQSEPKLLILDEPTRGIDVGAKFEIYKLITDIVKEGKAVIMVSSELPELIGMCDRIYIMCQGKISGCINREEFSQEVIMRYATGLKNG